MVRKMEPEKQRRNAKTDFTFGVAADGRAGDGAKQ